jgi:hypothetical protein
MTIKRNKNGVNTKIILLNSFLSSIFENITENTNTDIKITIV